MIKHEIKLARIHQFSNFPVTGNKNIFTCGLIKQKQILADRDFDNVNYDDTNYDEFQFQFYQPLCKTLTFLSRIT